MKDIIKRAILSLAIIVGGASLATPIMAPAPAYAVTTTPCSCKAKDESGNETTIPGEQIDGAILSYCDCGNGESIKAVLNLIVRILTIGVGIFGTIGIVIVGIQYLTAGPSEEQTRKAKRRMYEIVIGMAVYVLAYAVLSWLLPGFEPFGG